MYAYNGAFSAADICRKLLGEGSAQGKSLPYCDTQIVATAIANGMFLFTLGTVPFMLGFGSFVSLMGKKFSKKSRHCSKSNVTQLLTKLYNLNIMTFKRY